jgi:CRP/FNR family transcriptional regulator, cyclic AMP receptor protein
MYNILIDCCIAKLLNTGRVFMLLHKLLEETPDLFKILENMPEPIKKRCLIKTFPAKSIIHQKDDDLAYFSILCKGEVKILNEFDNGNSYVIEKNKAIDFIGEVAIIAGKKKTSVTTEAETDCIVLQVSRSDFHKWIEQDNNFLLLVSKRIANKLYNSSYTRGVELFYPAIHLVLTFIINYVSIKINNNHNVIIDTTRQQMAEELGLAVKTINRTIKRLKDNNLISIDKGKIHINKKQYIQLNELLENKKYV